MKAPHWRLVLKHGNTSDSMAMLSTRQKEVFKLKDITRIVEPSTFAEGEHKLEEWKREHPEIMSLVESGEYEIVGMLLSSTVPGQEILYNLVSTKLFKELGMMSTKPPSRNLP